MSDNKPCPRCAAVMTARHDAPDMRFWQCQACGRWFRERRDGALVWLHYSTLNRESETDERQEIDG